MDIEEQTLMEELKTSLLMGERGRLKACTGHVCHLSYDHAKDCAEDDKFVYRCVFCGFWHVDTGFRPRELWHYEQTPSVPSRVVGSTGYANQCKGKSKFPDRLSAMARLLYHQVLGHIREPIRVYFCIHCGAWHMGSGDTNDISDEIIQTVRESYLRELNSMALDIVWFETRLQNQVSV